MAAITKQLANGATPQLAELLVSVLMAHRRELNGLVVAGLGKRLLHIWETE
jgi:hypothetical protein